MIPPRTLRDRLLEARSALSDIAPAEGPVVAPVLAQIERALAHIEGTITPEGVETTRESTLELSTRESLHQELERLTPSGERSGLLDAVLNQSPHGILIADAQKALARAGAAEARFRSLAEAIPQIVWAIDVDGEHEYLSPKWNEYTGQAADMPLAERWRHALHPEDYDECFRRWAVAAESRSPWQVEYRIRRVDGVYRWHLGRSVPVFEDGRIVKWYGTATDINAQKRAIRTRDDILATVSHDLRNPLGNILLSAELLQEEGLEKDPGLIDTIKRSANRMSMLIRDLLDIAAIDGGELSIHRGPAQIGPLVAEAAAQQQQLAKQKRLTVRFVAAEPDVVVLCDQDRILQVFGNLIGNALKFTPAGGTITVSHRLQDDEVALTVSDTGPGIPADQLPRVFDRFWRNQDSVNAGSGLGLAICRGIIDQHGGRIWVESGEGQGATFVFTLPLRNEA